MHIDFSVSCTVDLEHKNFGSPIKSKQYTEEAQRMFSTSMQQRMFE